MQININNSTINNQVVNEYNGSGIHRKLRNEDWKELESFLDMRNVDTVENERHLQTSQELKKIVQKKDEKGLRGFIQRNKDNFFTNILSNTASTGLISVLKMLIV